MKLAKITKENVEKLYEIFCLDVNLDKDEFHDKRCCLDANGFYDKDINEIYEKVTKIIKDFENSETLYLYNYYKFSSTDGKRPVLKPCVFKPFEPILPAYKLKL